MGLSDARKLELDLRTFEAEYQQLPISLNDRLERIGMLEQQARKLDFLHLIVRAVMLRADVFAFGEHNTKAIATLKEAKLLLGAHFEPGRRVALLVKLAALHLRVQDWEQALVTTDEGVDLVEHIRLNAKGPYLQSSYMRLSIGLYVAGAIAAYELLQREKTDAAVQRKYAEQLLRCADLSKSRTSLFPYLERTDDSREILKIRQQLQDLRHQLDAAMPGMDDATIKALRTWRSNLWERLFVLRNQSISKEDLPRFSLDAVQATLEDDEAILYFYWIDRTTFFLATIDQQQYKIERRRLQQREWLEACVQKSLGISGASPPGLLEGFRDFSSDLLPQLGSPLLKNKRRLIVCAHRILHSVPFHALTWDNDHLIQQFAVSYVPNLISMLLPTYVPPPDPRVLVVGIPEFKVPTLADRPLPLVRQELASLKALYGPCCDTREGDQANKAWMRKSEQQGDLLSYSCLHFATHGEDLKSETPMESGLYFHDGQIDGIEISTWRLEAELVVLSACSSGQRPIYTRGGATRQEELAGDDWFGLPAAFFATGIKRLLSCLWPVEDSVAVPLMRDFHERLALVTNGAKDTPPEIALQNTLKDYLKKSNFQTRKLLFWAPFYLIVMGRRSR
jgi:CHAT domain-containing protein